MIGSTNVRFLFHSKTNSREQRKKETEMGTPSPSASTPGSQIQAWVNGPCPNPEAVRQSLPSPLQLPDDVDPAHFHPKTRPPLSNSFLCPVSLPVGWWSVWPRTGGPSPLTRRNPQKKKQTLLPLKESCNGSSSSFAPGALVQQRSPACRSVSALSYRARKDIPRQTHP